MGNSLTKLLTYGLEYFGLYYGTYHGQVKSTNDPENVGRIQVFCPTIHGALFPTVWAVPVSPMAGASFGLWHVPDVDEWVHVRFDHGRLEYPMWEGGWWGRGEPTDDMTVSNVVLCTKEGLKVVFNRTDKTILVQQDDGNNILIDGNAVTVNHTSDVIVNAQGDVRVNAEGDVKIVAQSNVDITAQGEVNISAQGAVTITSPDAINLDGDVTVSGMLSVDGVVTASAGMSVTGSVAATGEGTFNGGHTVSAHTHSGVTSGSSTTATPLG